jgi:hypothetical protein
MKEARFTDPKEFWKFVTDLSGPRHTVWIVCHNALFDMVVSGMPEQMLESNLVIEWPRSKRKREDNEPDNVHAVGIAVIDSPPTIIACRVTATNGRVVIVDTLNWFRCSLAEMGEPAGIPKFKMPEFSAPDSEWFRYCERDAQIVFTTFTELIRWVRENDMGMFRYTAPSQAISAFRHRFMKQNIYIHDNDDVQRLERRSYFGGRTEAFRLGPIDQTVHQYDINSLFPSVMEHGEFPRKLLRYEIREDWLALLPAIQWSHSVAEVWVDSSTGIFPARRNGMVIYPTGRFKAVLAGEELQHAISTGCVHAVRSWAEYECSKIFELWVSELWAMRQRYKAEGNRLYDAFVKQMLNSLYGKFGQLASEWANVPDRVAPQPWDRWSELNKVTGERAEFRSFGWMVQKCIPRKYMREYVVNVNGRSVTELREEWNELSSTFPAISAFVTAAARSRMNRLRNIAGTRNVYYQGVDSLVVTDEGRTNLEVTRCVRHSELGYLRHEITVSDGEIFGCADYSLGTKTVIAGRARQCIDQESGQMMQRKFASTAMLFDGSTVSSIDEQLQPWERAGTYNKGVRGADGWTNPHQLAEVAEPLIGG